MTDETIERLIARAKARIARGITKEEALRSLQQAGQLDENGNFTPPYQEFGKAVEYATRKRQEHGVQ